MKNGFMHWPANNTQAQNCRLLFDVSKPVGLKDSAVYTDVSLPLIEF